MNRKAIQLLACLFAFIAIQACGSQTEEQISTASLLTDMVNRDVIAKYPKPYYETKQFSSYDRNSTESDSASWYANWDRSQFIAVDSLKGHKEYVLFDADGPGAVTRFWATVADYSDKGILRFYLDGSETPQIEGELLSILSGHALVGAPLSTSVSSQTEYKQRGHNLYLPIPYSKHCKITYESPDMKGQGKYSGECLYYVVNYRSYEEGTQVKTFSLSDIKNNEMLLAQVQDELSKAPQEEEGCKLDSFTDAKISKNETKTIKLAGEAAIHRIDVKLKATDLEQALRSTILRISFDGDETVWAPVGDFFGSGNRLSPYQTHYTKVEADSVLSCFWTMPFQKDCELTIQNLGKEELTVSTKVYSSAWEWDEQSMHFGAGWTEYQKLYTGKTRSMEGTDQQFDINFVKLTGKGVYVGDGVTLFNSIADWWGEGDEKIYVDNESFPSHFGTGTEDYYGYAWCMHNFFEHPFIAEPDGSGSTQCGHVSNVRYRALDAIPFKEALKFDMEIWHWGSTYINYAPTTFWYMLPGGSSNRVAEPVKASAKIAKVKNDLVSNTVNSKGIVEGEYLDISLSGGIEKSQSIPRMNWSNGAQFFWLDAKKGDRAQLIFNVESKGSYVLKANLTHGHDYGIFDVYLNNKLLAKGLNLFDTDFNSKVMDFGRVGLLKGANTLEFVQKGKDKQGINTFLGIDYLSVD